MRRSAENIEEKKKTGTRITLKKEEKEKRKIHRKPSNNNIFGFTFYIKNYILLENIV